MEELRKPDARGKQKNRGKEWKKGRILCEAKTTFETNNNQSITNSLHKSIIWKYTLYYSNIFATHEFSIIREPIIINLEQLVVLECLECRLTTRDENQVFVETLVWTLRIITYVYLKGLCIAKIKIYIFFSCLPGN